MCSPSQNSGRPATLLAWTAKRRSALAVALAAACLALACAQSPGASAHTLATTSLTSFSSSSSSSSSSSEASGSAEVAGERTRRPIHPGGWSVEGGNFLSGGRRGGAGHPRGNPLRLEFGWKKMDFVFPSRAMRDEYTRSGRYNSTRIIALDMDVWQKGGRRRVFVTMPTGEGSPVGLGTVSHEGDRRAPLLAPYPDWSWHTKQGDCSTTISSVYRVAIDDYDRLWVLDRGDDVKCQPKILAFDLNTDRLLSRFEFGEDVLVDGSELITPAVDVRDHGRNVFVYIADAVGGLVVYDHQNRDAWRVNHPLTLPEERWANLTIAGSNFYLADGAFGLALGPLHRGHHHRDDRTLYFHSLASVRENYVKTSVLRNKANFPRGQNLASSAFKSFDRARKSQSAAEAMSAEGVLFSGLLPDLAVTCWDSRRSFGGRHLEVVARDAEALQFTSGMKVRYGRLLVLSSRYQRRATGTMDWSEVNYRILSARVSDLVRGTQCDPRASSVPRGEVPHCSGSCVTD